MYTKLIADNKVIHVFLSSRIPKAVYSLTRLSKIKLKPATKEERIPFLRKRLTKKKLDQFNLFQ